MMQMTLSNRKRYLLLGIILFLTISTIEILFFLSKNSKYQNLVISNKKWNKIIKSREESSKLQFQNIKFNDYNLIIDEEDSIIYYSIINSSTKYNPSIQYKPNHKKIKIAINQEITDFTLEKTNILKIMIYDNHTYHIYSLVVTNYPILSIEKEQNDNQGKIDIDLELFDNHVDSSQRLLKSKGKLKIIKNHQEYRFSLIKESLGHNDRENHISMFGMAKQDEYTIRKTINQVDNERYIQLFINQKYMGVYQLEPKEERRVR